MSSDLDWEDQRAFLAVLEGGSLSGAARRLGVAQPTVRARLESLEAALGVTLFTRSVRGLTPTPEARALGDAARAMSRASDAFVRAASGKPGEIAGTVRISVSDFIGAEVLPTLLRGLRAAHPGVIVEFVLSNASANLLEQEVDVAIRMHPPRQDALVARKAATIPMGLFAHVDYLQARGTPQGVADLHDHDLIGPDRAAGDLEFAASFFPDLPRSRFVVRTDNHPAQLAAARAGLGIAFAQRPAGRRDASLRQVLPELVLPVFETWVVTHEDLRALPRVRAVTDHLASALRACADGDA